MEANSIVNIADIGNGVCGLGRSHSKAISVNVAWVENRMCGLGCADLGLIMVLVWPGE